MTTRLKYGRAGALAVIGGGLCLLTTATPARAQVSSCVGDCGNINMVRINDLILGVNIALGSAEVSACPAFANAENQVDIAQLIKGVNNALTGCPTPPTATATATATQPLSDTATATPTVVEGTPTGTPTESPTPSPTATTPAGAIGSHLCQFIPGNTASHIELNVAALPNPLILPLSGSAQIDCGVKSAEGLAPCTCDINDITPIKIPGIGKVCISKKTDAPCDPLPIACDGGAPRGITVASSGNIGACTGNSECSTTCDAFCAGLGNGSVQQPVLGSSCTGFCNAGTMHACNVDEDCLAKCSNKTCSVTTTMPCSVDADCPMTPTQETCINQLCTGDADCPGGTCLPSDGACNGPDPVGTRAGICQCQCVNTGAGSAARPGDMQCNLGAVLKVVATNDDCTAPPMIDVGSACIALTTATVTSLIQNANFAFHCSVTTEQSCTIDADCAAPGCPDCVAGETCVPASLPASGPVSNTGVPVTCDVLMTAGENGAKIRGVTNFFGSALGDIVAELFTDCGPTP